MTRTRRTALLATGLAGASLPGAALALAAGGSSHRAAVRVPAQALAVCALDRLRPTLAAPVPLPSGTPLGRLGTAAPRRDAPGASAFPAPRQAAPGATTGAGSGPTGVTGGTGPADLRSSFGVLRRERAAADALPPEALAALRARGLDPIDVDAARLLRTTRDGGRAWVVPVAAIPPACDPVAETAPVVRALLPQRLRPGTVRPARPTTGTRSTPAPPTSAVPRPPRPAPAPPTSATGVRPPAPQAKPAR